MAVTPSVTQSLNIQLNFETKNWKSQIETARTDLTNLNKGFEKTTKTVKATERTTKSFGNALQYALGFIGTRALFENALAFDRVNNRMRAATESLEEYNIATQLASRLSQELGVDLLSASRGYATLIASTRGSRLEGAGTEELFESILKTSAALSLTADETNSVILAFSQVASKGKAAAEEIRGQIGERIPGFFLKLADAIGVTQKELSKMLDDGLLDAETALIASSKALEDGFGAGAEKNIKSLTAQFNILRNSIKSTGAEIVESRGAFATLLLGLNKTLELAGVGVEDDDVIDLPAIKNQILSLEKFIGSTDRERRLGLINEDAARESILKIRELVLENLSNSSLNRQQRLNLFGEFEFLRLSKDFSFASEAITDASSKYSTALSRERVARRQSNEELKDSNILLDDLLNLTKETASFNKEIIGSYEFQDKLVKDRLELERKAREEEKQAREDAKEAAEKAREEELKDLDRKRSIQQRLVSDLRDSLGFSPQEANEVSFISSVTGGSAEDQRQSRLARSRELGATRGDVDLAVQSYRELDKQTVLLDKIEKKLEVKRLEQ